MLALIRRLAPRRRDASSLVGYVSEYNAYPGAQLFFTEYLGQPQLAFYARRALLGGGSYRTGWPLPNVQKAPKLNPTCKTLQSCGGATVGTAWEFQHEGEEFYATRDHPPPDYFVHVAHTVEQVTPMCNK